jgi:hypothetical protein
MKIQPTNLYPRFKAAVALSGQPMAEIARELGVTRDSLVQVARGHATSARLRSYIEAYIDKWLTPELVQS